MVMVAGLPLELGLEVVLLLSSCVYISFLVCGIVLTASAPKWLHLVCAHSQNASEYLFLCVFVGLIELYV